MGGSALVIGAGGQVGNALCRVLGATALRSGRTAPRPGWFHIDLANLAQKRESAQMIIAQLRPSVVYCAGGATNVEACESDVSHTMNVNCHGPAALAYASREVPFVYFSTEYIFDGQGGPYAEDHRPAPISVYGCSKWEGEQAVMDAHPNPLIIRTTVVYGPETQRKNFVYSLRRVLREGKVMSVPGDQISTPTYNVDLATATVELVRRGQTGIFNVCGPDLLSRYEFAVLATQVFGLNASLIREVKTSELKQVARRPLNAGLVTQRLKDMLGPNGMRPSKEALTHWNTQGDPE